MEKLKANVIIWGNDNYNVLGLLRQLTPYIENVLFLINGKKGLCATKSKYCRHYKVVPSIRAGIEYLLELGECSHGKTFVITSSDLLAEAVDQHRDKLSQYYILSTTSETGILTRALDKNYQCEMARKVGIDVPASQLFNSETEVDGITYPCLIKPAFKKPDVHHPFKTRICHNESELKAAQGLLDKNGTYVLQQYIRKVKDLLVYGCRMGTGKVVYAGSFTKYRWVYGDGSYGTVDSEIPVSIDIEKLNAFLTEIDYRGLFSAEFGEEDGIAWFYEFNLRNDGTSHYFYQAGLANLPLAWVKYHLDGTVAESKKESQQVFMDEIGDYANVRDGLISEAEWKIQRRKATLFKYYDKEDKIPYYYAKAYQWLVRIYHIIKK